MLANVANTETSLGDATSRTYILLYRFDTLPAGLVEGSVPPLALKTEKQKHPLVGAAGIQSMPSVPPTHLT